MTLREYMNFIKAFLLSCQILLALQVNWQCFLKKTYDFNEGFKIVDKKINKFIIRGATLKEFYSNTLVSINDINLLRFIMKKILKQHYPDADFLGDKLF